MRLRPSSLFAAPGLTSADNLLLDHASIGSRRLTSAGLRRAFADRAAMSSIHRRALTVIGGGYLTPADGTGAHGSANDTQALLLGNPVRVQRHMPMVTGAKFWFKALTSVTRFQIDVWRRVNGHWYIVGSSNNLLYQLTANALNTVTFSRPILGVRRGDHIGWGFSCSSAVFPLVPASTPSYALTVAKTANAPSDDMWLSGTSNVPDAAVPIQLLGPPPDAVAIGDSLTAGSPGTRSLIEQATGGYFDTFTETAQYTWTVEQQLGISVQNMGISSQTSANIRTRFTADVVNLAPRLVFIWCGTNNIANEWPNFNQANWLSDMIVMIDAALNAGIFPVLLGIAPRRDWCNATYREAHNQRRAANTALLNLINTTYYGRALYVDTDALIGKNDPGGPQGNLDDIRDEYNADGVHLNSSGYAAIGAGVANAIAAELL